MTSGRQRHKGIVAFEIAQGTTGGVLRRWHELFDCYHGALSHPRCHQHPEQCLPVRGTKGFVSLTKLCPCRWQGQPSLWSGSLLQHLTVLLCWDALGTVHKKNVKRDFWQKSCTGSFPSVANMVFPVVFGARSPLVPSTELGQGISSLAGL